jgi:hypothetical protein
MHTASSTLKLLSLLTATAAVACSPEHESVITQPPAPTVSFNQGDGVLYSVNGGGIVNFSTAGVGNGWFSFNAVKKADGSVVGRFHQRRDTPAGLVEFSGIVTCLTIDAARMRGRIGGTVTENNSTNPNFLTENHDVGDDVWFRFADGGEGGDAVDASTTYGFKPTLVNTSAEYCALPFDGLPAWNPATTFPLLTGNIQIRP